MKSVKEARREMETQIGRLVVTVSELDEMISACKPLIIGEEFSDTWNKKPLAKRITAVRHHIVSLERERGCDHLKELKKILDEVETLVVIRNTVAHSPIHFRCARLDFSHGEFYFWQPEPNREWLADNIRTTADEGRELLNRLFDCLAAHRECAEDNYPEDIEEALTPP
ncbi:hypothetical protein [Salinicola sp. RZ23]|uniref:hypothetical protein n=1 Tax=Salinicola sp. RZ23 TaxID=1949087 RepID=UPI001300246F|nr:hypothetical protein [Salinicola sp. RZ23]